MQAARNERFRQEQERERLATVAKNKAAALVSRQNAQRVREELIAKRTAEVQSMERNHATEIAKAKTEMLENNRQKRAENFRSRFVSAHAAASFENSTFRRLYAMVRRISMMTVAISNSNDRADGNHSPIA